jgi:hypothetical protein
MQIGHRKALPLPKGSILYGLIEKKAGDLLPALQGEPVFLGIRLPEGIPPASIKIQGIHQDHPVLRTQVRCCMDLSGCFLRDPLAHLLPGFWILKIDRYRRCKKAAGRQLFIVPIDLDLI